MNSKIFKIGDIEEGEMILNSSSHLDVKSNYIKSVSYQKNTFVHLTGFTQCFSMNERKITTIILTVENRSIPAENFLKKIKK